MPIPFFSHAYDLLFNNINNGVLLHSFFPFLMMLDGLYVPHHIGPSRPVAVEISNKIYFQSWFFFYFCFYVFNIVHGDG